MSRDEARDPSTPPAAAAPDVEAILLVAHKVMERRPKRIGRGPDNDGEDPLFSPNALFS